ncbi:hypothetical protein [Rhodococcus oxybenzonivorans]|uniref:hypothetical protein n=1 Tax=Rhodococcus oxybenzonivorans TaxID=1990687 RepID=UPI001E48C9D5|nr:hypothetical protein [Rhodococcus oxybenzonivorans]
MSCPRCVCGDATARSSLFGIGAGGDPQAEMIVATRNTKHLEPLGVRYVNPWESNS